jgi:tetratricopeptide (TPR) repeat protein
VALKMGGAVELLSELAEKPSPSIANPVAATGRRRAAKSVARDKANAAVERFIRARKAPLPAPRNEREASLFAEDEFQAGKRLFLQGKLDEARAKLKLAVEHSPDVALYRLYDDLVDSRSRGHFLDAVATKRLAVQIAKEDSECAFAYYVLGYIAIDEGSGVSAKRLFRQAFKLDPDLVDAGRQARLLEMRGDEKALKTATPFHEIVPTLMRTAKAEAKPVTAAPKATPQNKRTLVLAGVLVLVVVAAVVVLALLKH